MDKNEILKNVYEDFFGADNVEIKIKKPAVDPQQDFSMKLSEEEKSKKNEELFTKINELNIDDKSKETLKKIIEYIRKYNEKIEKQFISFNMCIYSDNKETIDRVINVMHDGINSFEYMPQKKFFL